MGWLLLILSFWATVSGLVGVWLQKWIPALLAGGLQVEALLERIPELVEKLNVEADALMSGSSEMLERFYNEDVRPALAGINASWSYLTDVRSGRELRLEPFTLKASAREGLVGTECAFTGGANPGSVRNNCW